MKRSLWIALIIAAASLLLLLLALPSPAQPAPEAPEPAPARPDPEPSPEPAPAPEPVPEPTPRAPEELTDLLDLAGLELDELTCRQLIVVRSSGSEAQISAYERDAGGQWTKFAPTTAGHVGLGGVSADKVEGDKKTPAGLFPIVSAFGNQPDPGCKLPYCQATENSLWVDDPDSDKYNQWVEDDGHGDWSSAERIADRESSYAYAAVIGYNMDPVVPGAGSAIFLHVGHRPTTGCVSLEQDKLLELLLWLDPSLSPEILIF